MATKRQGQQPPDEVEQGRQLSAALGRQVMRTLGEPGDLLRVQVQRLWEEHYRVNVLVGADAASARIAHSYFLVADGDGHISACTPELTRQY
jgi:hypothetical protein